MEAPEPAKVHGFKCPICMAPFVEETTTRCGHIFCKKCIETAITAHHICPTCGKNATHKALVRAMANARTRRRTGNDTNMGNTL
ncbi:zinc finger, C3HC4 type (RING finger) protein [Medicago truncatula]|uniref:Zinc finger, C3HC4 type (RING finger) protein n=1 Tax=Medicago truncatula TaxID=3880 RepID=A0A072VHH7_MEDTR|nr:zinc finger, C3HC4 type (RING finger) protein [Medicago truncatula]